MELKTLAQHLMATQPATVRLPRGLAIAYHRDEAHHLTLSRLHVYPSQREIAICLYAFGAPNAATRSLDRQGDNLIVRLTWPLYYQQPLPGLQP